MDPQVRMLLELTFESFESGSYLPIPFRAFLAKASQVCYGRVSPVTCIPSRSLQD